MKNVMKKLFSENVIVFVAAIFLLALTISAMFSGCSSKPTATPSSSPTSPGTWTYEEFIQKHLTDKHLFAAQQPLCKKNIDGRKFWGALLKSIVKAESNFNPNSTYTETTQGIDPETGKQTVSVGLLQLSVKDKRGYKTAHCFDLNTTNIKEPLKNLGCGLEIMHKLIGTRSDLQASLGRYWSTIRPGHKAVTYLHQELPECK